jgi:hypothetical protein
MTLRLAALFAVSASALLVGLPALAQGAPDFGADTSAWANDGECDDPRFSGPGVAGVTVEVDRMADATDCRAAFEAGTAQLIEAQGSVAAPVAPAAMAAPAAPVAPAAPSVKGTQAAQPAAPATLAVPAAPAASAAAAPVASAPAPVAPVAVAPAAVIDYGSDSSEWANDGECDDRRFVGQGVATTLDWANVGRDASDCRALHEAGQIRVWNWTEAQAATQCAAISFGDDVSQFASNGVCDDPRFDGRGMDRVIAISESGHDATDCLQLCAFGAIALRDY